MMIWGLYLYGIAILLFLAAAALSVSDEHKGKHRQRANEGLTIFSPALGPGWILFMDGTGKYVGLAEREEYAC